MNNEEISSLTFYTTVLNVGLGKNKIFLGQGLTLEELKQFTDVMETVLVNR